MSIRGPAAGSVWAPAGPAAARPSRTAAATSANRTNGVRDPSLCIRVPLCSGRRPDAPLHPSSPIGRVSARPRRPAAGQDQDRNLEGFRRDLQQVRHRAAFLRGPSENDAVRTANVEVAQELLSVGEALGSDSTGAQKALEGTPHGEFVFDDRHHLSGVAHSAPPYRRPGEASIGPRAASDCTLVAVPPGVARRGVQKASPTPTWRPRLPALPQA